MGSRRLLVTDLDGTLIGDDGALGRFADWHADTRDDHWLVYATGRSRGSLERLIAASRLPVPDLVISLVGTEVHDRDGRPLPGWMERFTGAEADRARQLLATDRRLDLQGPEAQTHLKASFYAPALSADDLAGIRRELANAGLDATVVYSASLFLDVLPAAAGKGKAAREVARSLAVAPGDVLVFGDSGNDLELFEQGFRGTLVGNALPELQLGVGPDAYRSRFNYADGVLDGIRHWTNMAFRDSSSSVQGPGAVGAVRAAPVTGRR